KKRTDDSSRIIITATTVGAGVFLSIVLIVLLVKYKRRKRAPKLSTPVNIPLETNETSPEPLPDDEVYVKSEGKMNPVWSLSGNQGVERHQAPVAVNNQTASYQFVIEGVRGGSIYGDIAIDDISLMDSCPRDKGTTDGSSRIIIIATTLGAGVFLSIVLIVLLIKYKRRKRAPKLSFLVNIPLETNEISPEPLPVDEKPFYEIVAELYDDVGTSGNESGHTSADGQ
ncbi:MAM domain-containing glycosylphosphatidylinositol anchor 2 isoform X4, partial [Paramuricea clavata]